MGRRAHIGGISHPPVASTCLAFLAALRTDQFCAVTAQSRVSIPPRKTRSTETDLLCALELDSPTDFEQASGGQFCPTVLANICCRFRGNPLRADEDNFVHAPTVLWHTGTVVVTGEGSQRSLSRVSDAQSLLAPASRPCLRKSCQNARRFFFTANAARVMFPSCACRTVARKSCSNRRTDTGLHRLERLLFRSEAVFGRSRSEGSIESLIGKDDGAHQHVLEFAHVTRP